MDQKSQTKNKKIVEDILLIGKPDRRLLSKVPDPNGIRTNQDRRRIADNEKMQDMSVVIESENGGRRYLVNYEVVVQGSTGLTGIRCTGRSLDLSTSGMLLEVPKKAAQDLKHAEKIRLNFTITPGTMPEGYEMKVNIAAKIVRFGDAVGGKTQLGVQFVETLAQYATKKKNWFMVASASLLLFFIVASIMLMRVESILYFRFNKYLYLYSIIAATFLLTRYFFATLYRAVPIDNNFTPGVSIIIPCFNEELMIQRTILGCINQDYPLDKLEVIVVDDCSSDNSFEKIAEIVEELKAKEQLYDIHNRIRYVRQKKNAGKREAMAIGSLMARQELIVFVDSDSFLDPFAIRNLVQPFKDEEMGGVSGRTDVANTYTNTLTKMQSVRYYIAFRIMKAAESYFDTVSCLSGPLSCYRKELVLKYLDAWLNQRFLGEKATFGDDRSMTNFLLRHHRTCYQDTAVCSTMVPNTHNIFLKQQMRWKRSWLRESMVAAKFMWRKEPIAALTFYMGLIIPVASPIIVLFNLIYIPLVHRVFPFTFIVGIILMAFLMSMAQLLLRKSSTWSFGLLFVLYYEVILLWQMPIAWLTFWKTTWGTRMTPADLAAEAKKKRSTGEPLMKKAQLRQAKA
ncbi:MAG: glycosyltransferase [Negativicutes bacterium]